MFVLLDAPVVLVPDGTLLFHIIVIIVMISLLNRTLFAPINRILARRDQQTRGRSAEAKRILRQATESLSKYEKSLREARAESYRLVETERAGVMKERQERLEQVRHEISSSIEREKEEIMNQAATARTTIDSDAGRIAAEISAHVLGRSPEPDSYQQGD